MGREAMENGNHYDRTYTAGRAKSRRGRGAPAEGRRENPASLGKAESFPPWAFNGQMGKRGAVEAQLTLSEVPCILLLRDPCGAWPSNTFILFPRVEHPVLVTITLYIFSLYFN